MHPNARLTYRARLTLVQRICSGRPPAHVASEMGVSRQTAYKWLARWRTEGEDGLRDRPSRPHRSPNRVPISLERAVVALRRSEKLGPVLYRCPSLPSPPRPLTACSAALNSTASTVSTVPAGSRTGATSTPPQATCFIST